MRVSILFLSTIAFSAIVGLCVACTYGFREDTATTVGGFIGFALAKWKVKPRGNAQRDTSIAIGQPKLRYSNIIEATYVLGSVIVFAFIGWLTGYIHDHGALAGAICGSLGGFVLATIIPAMLRLQFMSQGRRRQLKASGFAFAGILAVICVMYKHLLS